MAQKKLPSQRRGRARPKYLANKKIGISNAKYPKDLQNYYGYSIKDFKSTALRTALLAEIILHGKEGFKDFEQYIIAPYKSFVGQTVRFDTFENGSIRLLKDISEGSTIYNIEASPKDGGKFCRAGATSAFIRQKKDGKVFLKMPSKVVKEFKEDCYATIGYPAGGNRKIKPVLKAGNKFHIVKKKPIEWPFVSRNSKNVKDHKFGGSGKKRPGGPTCASRHAPPGRKVGHIAPKRTGLKKKN